MLRTLSTLALGASVLFAQSTLAKTSAQTSDEVISLGSEAFIYGYPLVLMDATRQAMSEGPDGVSTMNQFSHVRTFPTPTTTSVVSPNSDTLYSTAWLDLNKEPIVLSTPDMGDRYFLLPILDAWTNVVSSPGSRTTGGKQQNFALVGPNWQGNLPEGIQKIDVPTNTAWIIGRILTNGPEDFAAVNALQDKLKLIPLSAWGTDVQMPNVSTDTNSKGVSPVEFVAEMDAKTFFNKLNDLLRQNPPPASDKPILDRIASIGISADKSFSNATPAQLTALEMSLDKGRKKLDEAGQNIPGAKLINGWQILTGLGDYKTDYFKRAVVALVGLGANLTADAIYPIARVDSQNQAFSGENRYVIHFNKDQLPPVQGFWSITMYNNQQFFVENPINRYKIGQLDQLKYNADGSLDLFIQASSPGADKEANWLPSPTDGFNLILRLYWPREEVINGTWQPAAVKRLD